MALIAAFFTLFALNFVGLALAAWVDYRARRRIRAGELPPRMPWLILWFGSGIDPFYLFSRAFRQLQDHTTLWVIWPLRLIYGAVFLAGWSAILLFGLLIWLNPA